MGKVILRVGKEGEDMARVLYAVEGKRYWLPCGKVILASVNRPVGGIAISLREREIRDCPDMGDLGDTVMPSVIEIRSNRII